MGFLVSEFPSSAFVRVSWFPAQTLISVVKLCLFKASSASRGRLRKVRNQQELCADENQNVIVPKVKSRGEIRERHWHGPGALLRLFIFQEALGCLRFVNFAARQSACAGKPLMTKSIRRGGGTAGITYPKNRISSTAMGCAAYCGGDLSYAPNTQCYYSGLGIIFGADIFVTGAATTPKTSRGRLPRRRCHSGARDAAACSCSGPWTSAPRPCTAIYVTTRIEGGSRWRPPFCLRTDDRTV